MSKKTMLEQAQEVGEKIDEIKKDLRQVFEPLLLPIIEWCSKILKKYE